VKRAVIGAAALGIVILSLIVILPMLMFVSQPDAAACGTAAPAAGAVTVGATKGLDANQLSNAGAIIAAARADPAVGDRGALVLLMAASQEDSLNNSKVANDHDSLGLFQMRPSMGWGTPEQVTNVDYELAKMISVLKQVPGWQSMDPGAAAQATERSAFPGAYAKWLDQANALLANAGGSTVAPAAAQCAPAAPSVAGGPAVQAAILFARSKLQQPYLWGGSMATGGFDGPYDCSGLTQAAYAKAGIPIGRDTYAQVLNGTPVLSAADLRPGDLLFPEAGHVQMVTSNVNGHVTIIEDPHTGAVVIEQPMWGTFWQARRIVQ
jgi:cell wall-associated NlpC family hydrolase